MYDILSYLVKSLVSNKDDVDISSEVDGNTTVFTVKVNALDMGGLLGRKGNIAQAIRTILRAYAKPNERVVVKFEELS